MKADRVFLQLWSGHRRNLLDELTFFRQQVELRVLSQFGDIEPEAEKFAAAEYDRLGQFFDPDRHDPSDFAEAAYERAEALCQMLENLRDQMTLGIIAGMYHEWDKQLRDWLVLEIRKMFAEEKLHAEIWRLNSVQVAELLDMCGWKLTQQPFYPMLEACRLVVNVYKHGNGPALNDLKLRFPNYLKVFGASSNAWPEFEVAADFTNLEVTVDDLQKFYEAIRQFWEFAPENTMVSDVSAIPKWFEKALKQPSKT